MSTAALEDLDRAEAVLSAAVEKLGKIEDVRDNYNLQLDHLDERRDASAGAHADARVACEMGEASIGEVERMRLDALTADDEFRTMLLARDSADRRVRDCERDLAAAEQAHADAVGAVALPVYERLQKQIREAARRLFALQRLWLEVSHTGGDSTPWEGHSLQFHGVEAEGPGCGHLRMIAREEGVSWDTLGPHPDRPLTRFTTAGLRDLAAEHHTN